MPFIKIRFNNEIQSHELEEGGRISDLFRVSYSVLSPSHHPWKPQMDLHEGPREIVAVVDLSGVRQEDIHLEMRRKSLKISGVRTDPSLANGVRYHLAEIPSGPFERVLQLHVPIDVNSVTATYIDGLLKIHMTKLPIEQTRKISITKG
ncbi:MAG: Hsp20/alpha crystallin family protein [Syntrophales bacterium]|jgi:HSP20 family protein